MPTLSVIVPSIGRATLARTLKSCAGADEVIVDRNDDGDHGYAARTRAIAKATGDLLLFMDDDDVFAPGAIELIRETAAADVPTFYRMSHPQYGLIWRDRQLRFGNIGSPQLCIPNQPNKLGRWEPYAPDLAEPGGDYVFALGCVEKMGEPIWDESVIAIVRPHARAAA